MPAPFRRRGPAAEITAHGGRLKDLELKPTKGAKDTIARTLSALLDTRINYKDEATAPKLGQLLAYGLTPGSVYPLQGKWRPAGGWLIESTFTDSDTGDLVVEEALADADEWDDAQAWIVSVSISVGGTFSAEPAPDITITIPAGTTATNVVHDGATSTITFTDGMTFDMPASTFGITLPQPTGTVRLIPEGGVTVEHPEFAFDYFGVNGDDQLTATVSWIYAGGIPFVQAAALIDDAVYPGSHTLNVIARAWPLPIPLDIGMTP